MLKKITVGFVVQTFDDQGKCIAQEFIAGDRPDHSPHRIIPQWKDEEGNPVIPPGSHQFEPFTMQQPTTTIDTMYLEMVAQTERIEDLRQRLFAVKKKEQEKNRG
jgi:hypothetical protein